MKEYKIAIWGWGVTGQSAANYFLKSINFKDKDLKIDIYDGAKKENFDARIIKNLPPFVSFNFETNNLNNVEQYDLIIKSPSILESHPDIVKARELGKIVCNDVSFFIKEWRKTNKKIIGVTGSNGKSTVVNLIYGSIFANGIETILVGNIGKSPLDYLLDFELGKINIDLPVIELSSYQLDTFNRDEFADIAVITNISPNHLDHHNNSMDEYVDAKLKVAGPDSKIITVLDDLGIQKYVLPKIKNPTLISLENLSEKATLFVDENNRELKGEHNLYNIAVALEVLKILNLDNEKSLDFIRKYSGLEHRIEFVKRIDGISYVNDSKSTSPDAVRVALETFGKFKNIVLIMGGSDKKVSFEILHDSINLYVKKLIILDQDINEKLIKIAEKLGIEYEIVPNLEEAANAAKNSSVKDDVVLFSPGAASQPKFKNFEERGQTFKVAVNNL